MKALLILVLAAALPATVHAEQPKQAGTAPRPVASAPAPTASPRASGGNPCAGFGPDFVQVEGSTTCVRVGVTVRIDAGIVR